ncbi:MAG: hypothetical protein KDB68_17555, partial [Planctomycetes bacterium]|nr:hypothetical protein [Planctomycetota bacterium]
MAIRYERATYSIDRRYTSSRSWSKVGSVITVLSSTSTSTGLRPEYEYDQSQNGGGNRVVGFEL